MSGKAAARVGDMHTCPMSDGPKPHVGGPVLPPGKPTVLIGGMPAATITDLCACASVPDIIMEGAKTVIINGLPASRQYDKTVHGGYITIGCPTVLIGGPSFVDESLLRFRPGEEEGPSLLGMLVKATVVVVAGVVALVGSGIAAGIAEVVNWSIGIYEAISGKDFITGEKLELWERGLAVTPLGTAGRKAIKVGVVATKNVARKIGGKLIRSGKAQNAAREGVTQVRQARLEKVYRLRKERAKNFYKKNNPAMSDTDIDSHLTGIDFTKKVKVVEITPGQELHRYVRTNDGKIIDRGEYFTRNPKASPSELGIGNYYEDANGQINMRLDRQTGTISSAKQEKVYGIESTAKNIDDNFSIPNSIQQTEGGANQIYIPRSQLYNFDKTH